MVSIFGVRNVWGSTIITTARSVVVRELAAGVLAVSRDNDGWCAGGVLFLQMASKDWGSVLSKSKMDGRSKAMANSLRVDFSIHERTGSTVPGESGSSWRVGHRIFSTSSSRSAAPSMNEDLE
jgi:hypothetical protein